MAPSGLLLAALVVGALGSPASTPAAAYGEPMVCEGQLFPAWGFVVGAAPPVQRYRSESDDPYILARGLAGDMRIKVAVVDAAGNCAVICDSPLVPPQMAGLTCPVRILFPPPRTVFVQVSGVGAFVVCEAPDVPHFPC